MLGGSGNWVVVHFPSKTLRPNPAIWSHVILALGSSIPMDEMGEVSERNQDSLEGIHLEGVHLRKKQITTRMGGGIWTRKVRKNMCTRAIAERRVDSKLGIPDCSCFSHFRDSPRSSCCWCELSIPEINSRGPSPGIYIRGSTSVESTHFTIEVIIFSITPSFALLVHLKIYNVKLENIYNCLGYLVFFFKKRLLSGKRT